MFRYLFQDYAANRGHAKIIFILIFFRLVHLFARRKKSFLWYVGLPLMVLYRVVVEYLLCVELRASTVAGPGLKIEHGYALVINDRTIIGRGVHLRHCTTIGCIRLPDGSQGPSPTIGDYVEVGANAVILGGIRIGHYAKIGAGSVVLTDIPDHAVAVGNPARVIKRGSESARAIPTKD